MQDAKRFIQITISKGDSKMKTSKDYKDLILEQLDLLDNINCRAMMGEYLL